MTRAGSANMVERRSKLPWEIETQARNHLTGAYNTAWYLEIKEPSCCKMKIKTTAGARLVFCSSPILPLPCENGLLSISWQQYRPP